MEDKIKWYKNKKILISIIGVVCLSIIIVIVLLNIITKPNSSKKNNSNEKSKVVFDINGAYMTDSEIDKMYSNTSNYIGKNLNVKGKVFQVEKMEDGYFIQFYRNIEGNEQNTLVFSSNKDLDIKENDYIQLKGYLDSDYKYENMMGTTISAPLIMAYELKKINYIDAVRPTLKSISVNQTQNQYNYNITIEKVEFAYKETRVYVSVKNNSSESFNFYLYNSKITQNGKQYEYEHNYEASYDELQTNLLPGTTTTGIITFPKIEQSEFNIILDGSSDDWKKEINPYQFNIKVQ
jgi:uncharacterized membrane protein